MLVNGARLNDAQSGHHNGDIPVSLLDVERIEVLLGGGASVHGADAVGGAINVITRRAGPRFASDIAFGQHDLVEAAAAVSLAAQPVEHVFSGEFNRSTGFAPRSRSRRQAGPLPGHGRRRGRRCRSAYLDKEFGAAGFYGPSPSREWTDQTLVSGEHRFEPRGSSLAVDRRRLPLARRPLRLRLAAAGAVRQPAPDPRRVGQRPVAHRPGRGDAAVARRLGRARRGRLDRRSASTRSRAPAASSSCARRSGRGWSCSPASASTTTTVFGTAWSPAIAASGWILPNLRWRTATGRSFRIPTYTELYYRDPNHLASDDLVPERAWSTDVGVDAYARGWTASATAFGRWDEDVIDWVRAVPTERWHTTNIRDVDTRGVELGVTRRLGPALWGVRYTGPARRGPDAGAALEVRARLRAARAVAVRGRPPGGGSISARTSPTPAGPTAGNTGSPTCGWPIRSAAPRSMPTSPTPSIRRIRK